MYYVELEYPFEEVLYETDYMACLKMQSDANNFGSTTANVYDVKNNLLIASYDEYGNDLQYKYDSFNRLTCYKINGIIAYSIQYDLNSNPINLAGYNLSFEDGKLVKMVQDDNVISFEYNSLGIRTKKL